MRFVAPIALFAVLIPLFLFALQRDPSKLPTPYLDKPAPTFALPELREPERTVGSADYRGELALLNVWATWCPGCRQEHAFLVDLASRIDVPLYGLNWRDNRDDAIRWLDTLGDPYVASGFDEDGKVGIDWGVYGAPETFLVDADGIVRHKHIGPLTDEIWQSRFVPKIEAAREDRQ